MATGHVLPAQKQAVSNLYRVRAAELAEGGGGGGDGPNSNKPKPSFIPENNNRRWLLTQAPVDSDRLNAIRRQARELWSGGVGGGAQPAAAAEQQHSSYQRHYSAKRLDEPTPLRPTSPNRRNNPHPPIVFLTCRLHNVPGFSNADSATDKAPYKVDASQSQAELEGRQRQRAKFANRPDSQALRQYADKDPMEEVFGQKLPFRVSGLGRWDDEADEDFTEARRRQADWQLSAKPSLHRYLKYQGPMERGSLDRGGGGGASRSAGPPPDQLERRWHQHQQQQQRLATVAGQRRRGWTAAPRDSHPGGLVYQPTRVRGDYLIHPAWPPTLPHHRVP